MAMLWPILVIIAVLGVVLPAAVWWLASRQASARPPYSRARRDAFGALMDPSMRGSPTTPNSRHYSA